MWKPIVDLLAKAGTALGIEVPELPGVGAVGETVTAAAAGVTETVAGAGQTVTDAAAAVTETVAGVGEQAGGAVGGRR